MESWNPEKKSYAGADDDSAAECSSAENSVHTSVL
jgi:hypothetical protein